MNKKKLKDNIKRIYNVILLLASVGILGAAVMIIHENEEKSIAEQKQYETISVQMIEKQLNISEDFIYNLVANNTDYPVIISENDNQRTLALVKINEYMTRETVLNNSVYYFFLYDTQRNSWVSRVGVNGNNNEIVYLKDYIKTTINGEKAAGYNWKLCNIHGNDYLIYIYRDGDVYVGAVADVNYLLNDIKSIADNSIFLCDAGDSSAEPGSGVEEGWHLFQGKLYYVFCDQLEGTSVHMTTYCDAKNIMTGFGWILFIITAVCIAALIPGMWFKYHIYHTVTVPIDRIAENMDKIKNGADVSELEDVTSEYTEISELNQTLKNMVDQIYGLEQVKLDYLHLQANPHFILNGLNMLYTILEQKKETELTGYVLMLVKHMRFMIHLKEKTIPLKGEMEFTRNYIGLYQKRVPFQIILQEEGTGQYPDMQVLPYSIQTIVENCVKYGMSKDGNIYIFISVEQAEGRNIIKISDRGKGINKDIGVMIAENQRVIDEYGKEHIGMYNVKSRMQMIFGDSALFEVLENPEGGSLICMSWKME